jgi:hypothetical protein
MRLRANVGDLPRRARQRTFVLDLEMPVPPEVTEHPPDGVL